MLVTFVTGAAKQANGPVTTADLPPTSQRSAQPTVRLGTQPGSYTQWNRAGQQPDHILHTEQQVSHKGFSGSDTMSWVLPSSDHFHQLSYVVLRSQAEFSGTAQWRSLGRGLYGHHSLLAINKHFCALPM